MSPLEAKIHAARLEAVRFIARCDDVLSKPNLRDYRVGGCAETAAVKRASMDLTRALANLRRGPNA